MKDRIEKIRKILKSEQYEISKVLNYTGLSMDKYNNLINDKEVELSENSLFCLELRLIKESGYLLK